MNSQLRLLNNRDFLKLWAGQTVSQVGSQITTLALPLTAILVVRASPLQVGLLGVAQFLPFILFGLPAGVWVDRMGKRRLLIASDIGRAIVLATIPTLYLMGRLTIWHLYLVAFSAGVLTVFFEIAYLSYLPFLVGRERLLQANVRLEVSRSGAQLVGPAAAGILVDLLKAPFALAADAASFLVSVLFLGLIGKREPPVALPKGGQAKMRTEILTGLKFVKGNQYLRSLAAATGILNVGSSMLNAVYLLYAIRVLGLDPRTIGFILAIGNGSFLLGALLSSRIPTRIGVGRTILGAVMLGPLGFLLIPLAPAAFPIPLLLAAAILSSFCIPLYNVNQLSLRQLITPPQLLGRMNATMRFIVWGLMPLGWLAGGALGNSIGLRATLWLSASIGLFAFLPILLSPVKAVTTLARGDSPVAGS